MKFFKASEIYVKLPHSVEYPTRRLTPVVPARGLWVSGIHRSIFNIDHGIMISNISTTKAEVHNYTSTPVDIDIIGISTIGYSIKNRTVRPQKYTTSFDSVDEQGIATLGIVTCNTNINVMKYTTSHERVDDAGIVTLGIVTRNNNMKPIVMPSIDYLAKGDSHGLFISRIESKRPTISDLP